jgi:hypothetical protein
MLSGSKRATCQWATCQRATSREACGSEKCLRQHGETAAAKNACGSMGVLKQISMRAGSNQFEQVYLFIFIPDQ